jgi:hypothetical protein
MQAKHLKHAREPNLDRAGFPPPLRPLQPAPVPQAQPVIRPEQTQSHVGPRPQAPAQPLCTLPPVTTVPIDAGNSNPLQPCWPLLPDSDNLPRDLSAYAEEICTVVNSLCGTSFCSEAFLEFSRHQVTVPSARPVWTVPDLSEQIEVGFVCGKFPDHCRRHA